MISFILFTQLLNMRILGLGCLLLVSIPLCAQDVILREKIRKASENIEQKMIAWRRDIHEHPELGNKEQRTAGLIADHLKKLGLEVKTGIAHTGVVGILKGGKPGPVVGLRADMDALPVTERTPVPFASKVKAPYSGGEVGVMHACGHDAHVAILMGVAEVLSSIKNDINGTIKFIFQPAEEGVPRGEEGGAELMVKEGVLENPRVDAIFGLHIKADLPVGKLTYKPGGIYASVNDMKIIIKGKSSHAAYPWQSIDPIIVAAQIITNLQTIVSRNLELTKNPAVVSIGAIHGGIRQNIIPEQVEMLGTLRAFTDEDEAMLIKRVKTIVTNIADAYGATAEIFIPYSSHYPVTFNDEALTAKMLPSLQATAGTGNIFLTPGFTGAEDFSFYQKKIPGLFIQLGGLPKGKDPKEAASHHTPDFFIDESGFKLGLNALANLAIDYLEMTSTRKKGK